MDITDEEKALFRQSQQKTKPIKATSKHVAPRKPKTFKPATDHREEDQVALDQSIAVAPVSFADQLFFHRGGLQQKLLRSLRQGKLTFDAELDLHGYKAKAAEQVLIDFISQAQQHGCRVIHIVHGKGHRSENQQPILKNLCNEFLQRHPAVLAFSSAPRHQGGSGAVTVILKTKIA